MGSIQRRDDLATAQDVLDRVIDLWRCRGGTGDLLIGTVHRSTGSGYSIAERNGGRIVQIVGSVANPDAHIHAGSSMAFDTLDRPRDTAVSATFPPDDFDEAATSVVQFFLTSGIPAEPSSGGCLN